MAIYTDSNTRIYITRQPMQLCKAVWGIKSPLHGRPKFVFCADDPTLSDMDAPELIPAGSTRRVENEPFNGIAGPFYITETNIRRERSAISFLA